MFKNIHWVHSKHFDLHRYLFARESLPVKQLDVARGKADCNASAVHCRTEKRVAFRFRSNSD